MTGHDDQAAALLKQPLHALLSEVEDHLRVPAPVGRTPGVAEITEILRREHRAEGAEDREAAEPGVIDADHCSAITLRAPACP